MRKTIASQFFKSTTKVLPTTSSNLIVSPLTNKSGTQLLRSSKPLMRMKVRVNCVGIVQTSEISSVKYFHSCSFKQFHSSLTKGSSYDYSDYNGVFVETFPQIHSQQGYVSVAGSTISYESISAEVENIQYSKKHFSEVCGPSNTTFSKDHHTE